MKLLFYLTSTLTILITLIFSYFTLQIQEAASIYQQQESLATSAKTTPQFKIKPSDLKLLDTCFFFTHDYAQETLKSMGPKGRLIYMTRITPFDMIYPIVYSSFFFSSFTLLHDNDSTCTHSSFKFTLFKSFVPAIFDYIENFGLFRLMFDYPVHNQNWWLSAIRYMNAMKFITFFLVLIWILYKFVDGDPFFSNRKQISNSSKQN